LRDSTVVYSENESSPELIWDEGLARYCSEILFRDKYPSHVRVLPIDQAKKYVEGLRRVISYERGIEALRELPREISPRQQSLLKA